MDKYLEFARKQNILENGGTILFVLRMAPKYMEKKKDWKNWKSEEEWRPSRHC